LITALQDLGARVRAFDPVGMNQARTILTDVTYCDSAYACAESADALVIATEWEQFRALDLARIRDLMACPIVVDLRNVYRSEEMHRYGFAYASIGRPVMAPALGEATARDEPLTLAKVRASAPTL
jgi:UDPglucose 6-dehydrogenase